MAHFCNSAHFPLAKLVFALGHTSCNSTWCTQLQSLVLTELRAWDVLKLCPGVLPQIFEIPSTQGQEEKSQQTFLMSRTLQKQEQSPTGKQVRLS